MITESMLDRYENNNLIPNKQKTIVENQEVQKTALNLKKWCLEMVKVEKPI